MRDWNLRPGDPLSLTLAADFRLSKPDYVNDHIWELEIGGGEPAALAIRTTYGLRARAMRLFYRFGELGKTITNPAEFSHHRTCGDSIRTFSGWNVLRSKVWKSPPNIWFLNLMP